MSKSKVFHASHETGAVRFLHYADGGVHKDKCIANIGHISGETRKIPAILCDGATEQDQWNILNLVNEQGIFKSQVAVCGAVSEQQRNELALRYMQPILGDCAIHSGYDLTNGGLNRYLNDPVLQNANKFFLLDDANDLNYRLSKHALIWDDEDQLQSHGRLVNTALFDMVKHDDHDELLAQVKPQDLIALLLDGTEGILTDAMMLEYKQFDRVIKKLGDALQKQGDQEFFVENVTPITPFKKNGVVNVGVIFEMNDTQTVTVLFNNPDTTPAKLNANDVLTSWKWVLNRRDVTAALQPKAKDSTRYTQIAKRMMQLLVKNHARFQRAAAEKLRKDRELQDAYEALDQKRQQLANVEQGIADEQAKIDAIHAAKQSNNDANVAPEPVPDVTPPEPIVAPEPNPNPEPQQVTEYNLKSTNPKARKPVGKIKLTLLQNNTYQVFGQEGTVGGEMIGDIDMVKSWLVGRYTPMGTALSDGASWDNVKTRLSLKSGDDVLDIGSVPQEPEQVEVPPIANTDTAPEPKLEVPEGFEIEERSKGYWSVSHKTLPQSIFARIFEQDQGGYQASFQSAVSTIADDLQTSVNWCVNTLNEFLAQMAANTQQEQDLIDNWENHIPSDIDPDVFKRGMAEIEKEAEKNGLAWNKADIFGFVVKANLRFLGAEKELEEFASLTNILSNTTNTMSRKLYALHTKGAVVLNGKSSKASQDRLEQYAQEIFNHEQMKDFTERQNAAKAERDAAKKAQAEQDVKDEIAYIWDNNIKTSQATILKWMNNGFRPESTKIGAINRFKFVKGNESYKVQNNNAYRALERMIRASNQVYGSFENALMELGVWQPTVPDITPNPIPETEPVVNVAVDPGATPVSENPDEAYLNQVIHGGIDLTDPLVGDRLEQIGENLPSELESLFEQAADVYAAFAIENAKKAG